MDELDAQHRAGALQLHSHEGCAVVDVDLLGNAAARDGGAQHGLSRPRVLLRRPDAVHEQAGVIVDEQEELGLAAARDPR